MKKLTKNHPSARWMIFSGCSLIGRSPPVEPFSFSDARGIFDVCLFLYCMLAALGYYFLYIYIWKYCKKVDEIFVFSNIIYIFAV